MSILIDSDVLIWYTRGYAGAAARLRQLDRWRISAITYMELAQGCRNQQELAQVKRGLALCNTEIVPVTSTITERAIQLIDAYALAAGLQVADALIAATAIELDFVLLSANTKHFAAIGPLRSERFAPSG